MNHSPAAMHEAVSGGVMPCHLLSFPRTRDGSEKLLLFLNPSCTIQSPRLIQDGMAVLCSV